MNDDAHARALDRLGDDPWNAFLHVDRARQPGDIVVSIKDNLAVARQPMTCASTHLKDYVAPYDATVVERLRAGGAILLGKTNMDEFAAGSSGENSAFGPTRNPRDPTRVPGGSSSGAGASVASGVCDAALGSDTGGSIRCPAAFCGAVALKPTRGLVSRYGMADLAMSLESPAPLAKDAATLARVMDLIAGPDPRDPVTQEATAGGFQEAVQRGGAVEGARIGVPREMMEGLDADVERAVREAMRRIEAKGASFREVALPHVHHALAAYYVVNYAEFASAMQRLDGIRYGTHAASAEAARTDFGDEVKRRILLGTFVTSREERGRWYDAAVRVRAQVAREFDAALASCDALMAPTMPMRAFRLGERGADPRTMYAADVLTVPANLAGIPAGSVPVHKEGLPIGLQVMGRAGDDRRVVALMAEVERVR